MERFVFVTAVTLAIIVGVVAVFGGHWGPHFNFNIDTDARPTSPVVTVAAGRVEQRAYAGSKLRLQDLAANVTITPEDRTDFLIEIDNSAGRAPTPVIRTEGDRVVVDGQLHNRISNCRDGGASLRGYDDITAEQMPHIIIHAPRALDVDRSGAGTTAIAAAQSVDLDLSGCGAATVGDVADELSVDVSGTGTVQAGAARKLTADISGTGDVSTGAIAQDADLDVSGSGSVTMASLAGDLSVDGSGTGHISVKGGAINQADINLAGTGGVDIAATVQTLNVDIMGISNVDVTAPVHDVQADIAGVGNVNLQSVTGSMHQDVAGPGGVHVGH